MASDLERIQELYKDILDFQDMLGKAQDAKHFNAAEDFVGLIKDAEFNVNVILNDGMVPA